jgi:hypothetical protein
LVAFMAWLAFMALPSDLATCRRMPIPETCN